MGATITRRAVLTAAPGVTMGAVLATAPAFTVAVAFEAAQVAPPPSIMALFRQWRTVRDRFNAGEDDEATEDRLYAQMREIECRILPLPCVSASDLAAKYVIHTDCGTFEADEQFAGECWALLRGEES